MSEYCIEVEVSERDPVSGCMVKVWKQLRPSGRNAQPYRYSTRRKAERIRALCYPSYETGTRVREVV